VSGFEKRSNFTHSSKISNLNFDTIVAMNYEFETCYDYLMIILLHLLRIPSPAHFLCGPEECTYYTWPRTSRFIRSDRRLSAASNVGFVKQKA